jgi:hypothetical protein
VWGVRVQYSLGRFSSERVYPLHYFSGFPAFPTDGRVFVAMNFHPTFTPRWEQVIAPAVRAIKHGGQRLEPHRLDVSRASDAMVTEILRGIGRATLVLADISATAVLDGKAVRNSNVMYEVGLAHAVRQPQEVILIRSDKSALDFDIAGVRVHSYDPDSNPDEAKKWLSQLLMDSLTSIEAHRSLSLESAMRSLSAPAVQLLLEVALDDGVTVQHPSMQTFGDVLSGLQRTQAIEMLLRVGALETNITVVPKDKLNVPIESINDLIHYRLTSFGQALQMKIGMGMGAMSVESTDATDIGS